MIALDGRKVTKPYQERCDVVVVGSGPAGATVARTLARAGVGVTVVEEGYLAAPEDLPADSFTAMAELYRDMGASLLRGSAPMPFVQGRVVGGTSVVNGAISWRLPRDIHEEWVKADPALQEALPWERLLELFDRIEEDLHIAPTDPAVAGPNNLLMAKGAEALGLEHRPIARNVKGCEGLGRCMQGCPLGRKMAMDLSYLPDAVNHGARILSGVRVHTLLRENDRAVGVVGDTEGGDHVTVMASRAVVLAASAVQTPAMLRANRIRHGPVGNGLSCHPGVSMAGRFPEPVRVWTGATQGHEVIGLRKEGIKFEGLGFDITVAAARIKGIGRDLASGISDLAHRAAWGAAIRAEARGRVRPGRRRARVYFTPTRNDIAKTRRSIQVLGEMMLAAGAECVFPGVHGWHTRVDDRLVMRTFTETAPWNPRAYTGVVTHLFGTCRMGSDPGRSVVRPDFRHHQVDRLYVADSSVFPTNIGVNPQTSIIALAWLCAERIAAG
jgi:choline dehydrogenase-like flavoprotein